MIYPLNEMIESLLAQSINEETGEVLLTDEELQAKIQELKLDFDEQIKALRNSYMTQKADAEVAAAEASALYKLQQESSKFAKSLENKAERTKRFIAWLLQGEKFQKCGCKISYINRQIVEYDDGFVAWAVENAPQLLNEPSIRRKDVEAALKAGQEIHFAHLEPKKYITIK